MSYTRGQFCKDILVALGNPLPNQCTQNFMIAWTLEESGHDLSHIASYNLMNTTQRMTGSTSFNQVGVQNYKTYADGITATKNTLLNGLYPNLSHALASNDCNNLGITGSMSSGVAGDLSVWVNGQRSPVATSYISAITQIAQNVGNAANDTASGTPTGVTYTGNPVTPVLPGISGVFSDPARIIKLVVAILLIAGALLLLFMPEAQPINAAINAITKNVSKAVS